MDDRELGHRIRRAADRIVVPERPLRRPRRAWAARTGAIAVTAAVLVSAIVVGQQLAERRGGGVATSPAPTASSTATGSPTPTATPTATVMPTAPAQPLPVTYESPVFGYRLQLPEGYRRTECLSFHRGDRFTLLSEEEERAQELGHIAGGGPVVMWTFAVNVYDADGRSPVEWAEGWAALGEGEERVEPVELDGLEAARRVADGEALLYVLRSGDRMYVIWLYFNSFVAGPRPDVLPHGVVDSVAATFEPGPPGPVPTETPLLATPPPAAREAAAQLADAFEAGDADRIAMLITPRCWLHIWLPNAGPTGHPVDRYMSQLREQLARGDLRVTVDPTVQVAQEDGPGRLRLFIRSE
ncbi:MAG: hypothetical protein ACRDT4_27380, partial [Micromonosporaceae bacterium]